MRAARGAQGWRTPTERPAVRELGGCDPPTFDVNGIGMLLGWHSLWETRTGSVPLLPANPCVWYLGTEHRPPGRSPVPHSTGSDFDANGTLLNGTLLYLLKDPRYPLRPDPRPSTLSCASAAWRHRPALWQTMTSPTWTGSNLAEASCMLCMAIRRSLHPCNVQLNAPPPCYPPLPPSRPPTSVIRPTNTHNRAGVSIPPHTERLIILPSTGTRALGRTATGRCSMT